MEECSISMLLLGFPCSPVMLVVNGEDRGEEEEKRVRLCVREGERGVSCSEWCFLGLNSKANCWGLVAGDRCDGLLSSSLSPSSLEKSLTLDRALSLTPPLQN